MQSQFSKGLTFLGVLLYLLYGLYTPGYAHAASFNGNVKECIENPKQCEKQQTDAKTSSKQSGSGSESASPVVTIWDIARMIFALIFVICLLYVVLKFINKRSRSYQNSKLIQNFGGTPLGGNKSLQVVKAGRRILILGVGEDVHLIKEIDDQEEVKTFVDQYNQKLEQTLEPRDVVTKLLNYLKNRQKTTKVQTPFGELLKSQILAMKQERAAAMKELELKEKRKDE